MLLNVLSKEEIKEYHHLLQEEKKLWIKKSPLLIFHIQEIFVFEKVYHPYEIL